MEPSSIRRWRRLQGRQGRFGHSYPCSRAGRCARTQLFVPQPTTVYFTFRCSSGFSLLLIIAQVSARRAYSPNFHCTIPLYIKLYYNAQLCCVCYILSLSAVSTGMRGFLKGIYGSFNPIYLQYIKRTLIHLYTILILSTKFHVFK